MKKFTVLLFVIIAMVTIGHEKQIKDVNSGMKKVNYSGFLNQSHNDVIPSLLENAITIKLKEGVGEFEKQTGVVNFGIQSLDEKVSQFEVYQLEKRFRYNPAKLKAGMPDLSRIYMIQFPSEHNVQHVADIFSKDPNVEYAEPIPLDFPPIFPTMQCIIFASTSRKSWRLKPGIFFMAKTGHRLSSLSLITVWTGSILI
jgi:hypothetical protein